LTFSLSRWYNVGMKIKIKKKKEKEITLDDLALMMGRGFNEVHEKMDKGFAGVDKKFDEVDKRFDEVDEKFDEVYKNMGKGFANVDMRFDEVHKEISELKESFNTLQIAVDGYAKKADDYFQEMVVLSHKVDRIERWVLQLAEKVGVQLKA